MTRWCEAGLNHIWLRQDNNIQLCCSLAHSVDQHRIQLEKPEDFLNVISGKRFQKKYRDLEKIGGLSNGECSICKSVEVDKNTGGSQRQKIQDLTQKGTKFYFKIDFSNKCNLKCVMCSSQRSTGWIKDEQKMNNMLPDNMYVPVESYQTIGDDWWEKIPLEWWSNLGAIELSGGEPLYQEDALRFIDFLSKNVPDCYLRIMTNATLVDGNILDNLNRFSRLNIAVSVDAWQDDVYRYSRGDHYGIDDIKNNLNEILNLCKTKLGARVGICDTLHPVNYDQADLGKQWVNEWRSKNNSTILNYTVGHVHRPLHLDIRKVLPKNLYVHSREDKKLQIYFYKWITALDKVRKTNILDVRPDFKEWFNTMEDLE